MHARRRTLRKRTRGGVRYENAHKGLYYAILYKMKKELKIFDNPKNIKRLLIGFFSFLAVLLIIDLFMHKHGHFSWEETTGFFAVYGFVAYVSLIFIAKALRLFVKRDEDYYDK